MVPGHADKLLRVGPENPWKTLRGNAFPFPKPDMAMVKTHTQTRRNDLSPIRFLRANAVGFSKGVHNSRRATFG